MTPPPDPTLSQRLAVACGFNAAELVFFGLGLAVLQRLIPAYPAQANYTRDGAHDLFYSFVLTASTPFFIALPMAVVGAAQAAFPALAAAPAALAGRVGLGGQVLLAVLVIDLVSYFRHRLMHTRWLWPVHAIHHSSRRLTWLSTERFHLLNHLVTATINIVVVRLFFPPVPTFLSSMLRRGYNFFIHSNVRVDYGPLGYLLVSPRFHHWHHSRAAEAIDTNFSTFFSGVDWLFGTFYLPADGSYPADLGEPGDIPEDLVAQAAYPFREWGRMARGGAATRASV